MAKLTDLQLKINAKDCFTADKECDKLFVTEDGNCFKSQNLASNHNRSIKDGKIITLSRKDVQFISNKDNKKE